MSLIKSLNNSVTIIFILLLSNLGQASDAGKIWPSEKKTWIDPEFGHEITQWTQNSAQSWHLYFNIESFIDEHHAIIFSERNGSLQLYNLDLNSGEMVQMTDEENLDSGVWHWPELNTLWFSCDNTIKALNTKTHSVRTVKELQAPPRSMTITCDGKWIVTSVDKSQYNENASHMQRGPYAILKISTETGEITQISPEYGFVIGHLQANPVKPDMISYCWQHLYQKGDYPGTRGATPLRIWWINVDGTDGGPVGPQEFGIHRTHEFWFPDGSRIGYSARYQYGPNKGRQFLGSSDPDGSDAYLLEAPVKYAHSQMFKDGRHWVADLHAGKILTLFTLDDRKLSEIQPLFRHDSSWKGQASHPHPHFSPDGRLVLMSTDKTGTAQVYTVKTNIKPGL